MLSKECAKTIPPHPCSDFLYLSFRGSLAAAEARCVETPGITGEVVRMRRSVVAASAALGEAVEAGVGQVSATKQNRVVDYLRGRRARHLEKLLENLLLKVAAKASKELIRPVPKQAAFLRVSKGRTN